MAFEAGTRLKLNGPRSCACAVWINGTSVDSKPKAAMTVERIFELVNDCLVSIDVCFLRFGFGSCRRVCFCAGHMRKRKSGLKPATTVEFFWSPPAGL